MPGNMSWQLVSLMVAMTTGLQSDGATAVPCNDSVCIIAAAAWPWHVISPVSCMRELAPSEWMCFPG
jgi:hypothetical protein